MPISKRDYRLDRRRFLQEYACGIGTAALAYLMGSEGCLAAQNPLTPKAPHFPARAKNVIFLLMDGGPSQIDLFDPKPALQQANGKPLPESIAKNLQLAFAKPNAAVLASPRQFRKYGQCGMDISDLMPHLATCTDDIALVRSMHTDAFNHAPGQLLLMSGSMVAGRPSLGSWALYGLGSESQDLPGFVVLSSKSIDNGNFGGPANYTNGFLPPTYQGVPFRSSGDAVLYLSNPPGISREMQRQDIDAISAMNQQHHETQGDGGILARINSYELAFRMQAAAPDLLNLSREPDHIRKMYGIDEELTKPFGTNCLLARRMVEQGVRFILLTHSTWDDHDNLNKNITKNCQMTDRPVAALLKDLKQRGLLDHTLVVWGGEFGRTPVVETRGQSDPEKIGRDHHPLAYTMWLAGGGIRAGQVLGKTDDFCMSILEDPVHVHDLQATILHCLGFDHTKLVYRAMGRDFRLTDVSGSVVKRLLV